MMEEIRESHLSNDVEKKGYLQKKTSKGLWVNRYFVTEGNFLHYWHESVDYDVKKPSCEKYDISEVKSLEKVGSHGITLNFLNNSKFKLEIKAAVVTERNEWFEVLDAKKRLYSIDELLNDIKLDRISFKTKTFSALMQLHEREQNKWILDRLDEAFESSNDDQLVQQFRSNSSRLLLAATRAMEEFLKTCEDCEQEMFSREPKVIAHCRNYIRRYADIIKGRISLELLYLPGIENKQFEVLEEKALCTALILSDRIDHLNKFSFISKEFIQTINKTLFSTGDLLSALIKLSATRIDAFFEVITSSTLDVRMKKIIEIQSILDEFLCLIKDDLTDPILFQMVLGKVITTQLLSFADHILLLDLADYTEHSLIEHIHACETIYHTLSNTYVDLSTRNLCFNENICNQRRHSAANPVKDHLVYPNYYFISSDILDSISMSCNTSIRNAIAKAIADIEVGRKYLLKGFLQETYDGWMGGVLCSALISNITQWLHSFLEETPSQYAYTIHQSIYQMVTMMFMKNIIDVYKSNKSLSLSNQGILQLKNDFNAILNWILDQQQFAQKQLQHQSRSLGEAMLTNSNKFINSTEAVPVPAIEFLQVVQTFLLCTDATALKYFADAILIFGIKYKYHLYDCLRLLLKVRCDIKDRVRKAILSICNEFVVQLEQATITNPKLVEGKFSGNCYLLEDIFPLAGIEHCTGMKWKLEIPSDPTSIRLTVTLMVNEICNQAVTQKRQRNSILLSENNNPSSNSGSPHDNRAEAVDNSALNVSPYKESVRLTPMSVRKYMVDETGQRLSANPTENNSHKPSEDSRAHSLDLHSNPHQTLQQPHMSTSQLSGHIKPKQPPPPPPRRNSATSNNLPPTAQSHPPAQHRDDVVLNVHSKQEKTRSSNPFDDDEPELKPDSAHSTQVPINVAVSAAPVRPPPPKPPRRKSSTESPGPASENSSAKNPPVSQDHPDAPSQNQNSSSNTEPPNHRRSLTPQEALNMLLKSAQQNLDEKNS